MCVKVHVLLLCDNFQTWCEQMLNDIFEWSECIEFNLPRSSSPQIKRKMFFLPSTWLCMFEWLNMLQILFTFQDSGEVCPFAGNLCYLSSYLWSACFVMAMTLYFWSWHFLTSLKKNKLWGVYTFLITVISQMLILIMAAGTWYLITVSLDGMHDRKKGVVVLHCLGFLSCRNRMWLLQI